MIAAEKAQETLNPDKVQFFEDMISQHLALTFDDVLIYPHRSEYDQTEVATTSRFTKNVDLKIPFASAAMDTVTESNMAIAMAKLGGIGVIHSGLSVEEQKREVRRVKLHLNGLIERPVSFSSDRSLESVLEECDNRGYDFRTFPVIDSEKRLVGLLTQSDIDFCEDNSVDLNSIMTPFEQLTVAPTGTDIIDAYKTMLQNRIKTLPILSKFGRVKGLYVFSDVSRLVRGDADHYNVDNAGRLRVAAAVPTDKEALTRVGEMKDYLDVAVIDTAHGDLKYTFRTLKQLKKEFPGIDIMAGNVSVGESARDLAKAGADGIKVGQGPGSICSTRPKTGMGHPQVSAVYECVKAVTKHSVPICADGGITKEGDVSIAIVAGAESVMMGRMLSGTDESPGDIIVKPDNSRVKAYRGMGSSGALKESAAARKRYGGSKNFEPMAEGVESEVPYQGSVVNVVDGIVIALRTSMSYVGSANIQRHRMDTDLMRVTNSGLRESHPHDVTVSG